MKLPLLALPLVIGLGMPDAKADTVSDFYKGKTIRVIVGASAGGSYDTVARMMSRHFKRYIRGKPKMIVQNRPGASSRVAANWLYNAGPRDGSVIGSFSQTLAFAQVLGQRRVKYDARKFHWIGTPIQPVSVMIAWHDAGIKNLLEARNKEFIVGATSSTGANFIYPALANYLFGTKLKIVIGYKGGTQVDLALERGEVAMRGSGTWSDIKGNRPHWLTGNKIVPIVQNSLKKHPDLPNVPRFVDLATNAEQKAVLSLMGKVASIGRPMLTNRGVPADRVAALRKGFEETMKDAKFLGEAKKHTLDVNPMRGEDVQKLVADILATPKSVIDTTNAALSRKATKCTKFTKAKYCRTKKKKKKKKKSS
jgi:tripartite-type tricarboxylate transporter receptor subunit TctC